MARRRKGTEKTGGRKKGTPNRISGTVKEWIASIIDTNRNKFEEDLELLEPGDRVRVISNLLQYVTPKMQSVSPGEMLDAEYRKLEELLESAPDEVVDKIVERINKLKGRTQSGQNSIPVELWLAAEDGKPGEPEFEEWLVCCTEAVDDYFAMTGKKDHDSIFARYVREYGRREKRVS